MKKKELQIKNLYIPPKIKIEYVEMECSIGAGSANFRPGNESNSDIPQVGDWDEEGDSGNGVNNYDL
ncbi:hypothetical protein CMT19_16710 [Elizabethkingia anophelis]|nr:hypothetical protein [Elizabethkingia anophelis]